MPLDIPLATETAGYTVVIDGRTYRPFLLDSSGHLILVGIGAGGAIEVIQDTPADLKAAVYGIDGATQRQAAVDASGRLRVSDPRERTRTMITRQYAAGDIAPHAVTDRWSYTVPASKLAIVEVVGAVAIRSGAATTARVTSAIIEVTPSGVSATRIVQAIFQDNTVGARAEGRLGLNLLLAAGDVIKGQTEDQSTGGTVTYVVTMIATEFDA